MGYYKDLEYEFVERTMLLIEQYESVWHKFEFKEQYNYTLLINCLTGLIVLPKEKTIDAIPNERLLSKMKRDMGLNATIINSDFTYVKELIIALRHAVAHFMIKVESHSEELLIDEIIFYDEEKGAGYEVARFKADELLPFLRYYASWLLSNLKSKTQHIAQAIAKA